MDKYKVYIFSFLLSSIAYGEKTPTSAVKKHKFFGDNETFIRDPMKMRDPFKKHMKTVSVAKKKKKKRLVDGKYSNVPDIADLPISDIEVTGILMGKNRLAVAKSKRGGSSYIIKEGMTLGEQKAEVKAVLPGGIVLVEKILNIYGQEEYIETVIPIVADDFDFLK